MSVAAQWIGFVHVVNEILDMLLFTELLCCHTPCSGEPLMSSARAICHYEATLYGVMLCVNI